MLQFLHVNGEDVIYINPHQVVAVRGTFNYDAKCQIYTVGDEVPWPVKGSAAEAQLRVWKAL